MVRALLLLTLSGCIGPLIDAYELCPWCFQ